MKLCYFVIDMFEALIPSVKFSKTKIETIANSFRRHQLGNIQAEDILSYYCPEKGKKTNAENVFTM